MMFAYIVIIEYKSRHDLPRHPCGSDPDHDRVSGQLLECSPYCIVLNLPGYYQQLFNVHGHLSAQHTGSAAGNYAR